MADPAPPASVFITGATGFMGTALVERFRKLGSEVRGVDLNAGEDPEIVEGDVTEPGDWQRHAEGCELVIHTAAVTAMYSSGDGFWEGNVVAPRRAVDAAIAAGAKRLLHISSAIVFGFDFEGEVDERTPVRPNGNQYVDTKIASEQVVLSAHAEGEIPCTIVRPGEVYGPRSSGWTIEAIRALKARPRRMVLPAGGRGLLSPVYVDDLIDGIVLAATVPEAAGRIFILAGPEPATLGEFMGHYCRMLGIRGPLTAPAAIVRQGVRAMAAAERLRGRRSKLTPDVVDSLTRRGRGYSIRRARETLGYEPRDLEAGMRETEQWLRSARLL